MLLTGGTAQARRLAEELAARLEGVEIIYALAGLTEAPRLPRHPHVRVQQGGFGGAEGLAAWLEREGIAAVIDATHPFARSMPQQVATAAQQAGAPHVRFLPPTPALSVFPCSISHASLPGLTRQSMTATSCIRCLLDARVKPGHDDRAGLQHEMSTAVPVRLSSCPLPSSPRKRGSRAPFRAFMRSPQRAVGSRLRGNDGKECGKVLDAGVRLVDSLADMALVLPRGAQVVAALGSRGLVALRARPDLHLHARMLMPPAFSPPPRWRLLTGRQAGAPRGMLVREMAWLRATRAQWVLARHSAGSHALVRAALHLGLSVLLQRRPAPPSGTLVLEQPEAVEEWLRRQVLPSPRS